MAGAVVVVVAVAVAGAVGVAVAVAVGVAVGVGVAVAGAMAGAVAVAGAVKVKVKVEVVVGVGVGVAVAVAVAVAVGVGVAVNKNNFKEKEMKNNMPCKTVLITRKEITENEKQEINKPDYFKDILLLIKDDISDYNIPQEFGDLIADTDRRVYRRVKTDEAMPVDGPGPFLFYAPDRLKRIEIKLPPLNEFSDLKERHIEIDPHNNQDGYYNGFGVSLIQSCTYYPPEGMLVWIPDFKVFGTLDPDHQELKVFPKSTWTDIEENICLYLAAGWGLSEEYFMHGNIYKYFNPWDRWDFIKE